MDSNPDKAERDWPPVVVAGAFNTGIVLMRNLARRGVRTCCIDSNRRLPGFQTVYGPAYECPNPDEKPSEWVAFMIDLARTLGTRPVFISSADQYVWALAQHANALAEHYVFHRAGVDLQAFLATKQQQYELAARHGMPIPRSRTIQNEAEVSEFASSAQFPCLLKPLHQREWAYLPAGHPLRGKAVRIVDDADALLAQYRLAAEINPRIVVQEVIVGPDTAKFVYLSCYARNGDRIGSCVVRELRTMPIGYGSASVVEPVTDPEIDRVCDQFFRSLGYVGLCEIELKRDSRDGRLLMIEANPRYSVTADAAPYAGVDLGWLHYLDLIGQTVTPVGPDGRYFRHIVLFRDFATMRSYRHAGLETWRSILSSYQGPVVFYDFDLRDWRVSVRTLKEITRSLLDPALRVLFPRRFGQRP